MKPGIKIWVVALLLLPGAFLLGQNETDCFLRDFQPKRALIPHSTNKIKPKSQASVTITVDVQESPIKISNYIYGDNVNLWMGPIVTEPVLLDHILYLNPGILRFPGGNISNVYFWNADVGETPADAPDSLYNQAGEKISAEYWFGRNDSSNTITLDNYYTLLKETGSTGVICVNFGYSRYGTSFNPVAKAAHLAAEWVRYDHGRTKFWEIGNEDFGPWQAGFKIDTTRNQDAQPEIVRGQIYGKHFNVFADSMRQAAAEIDAEIYIGAQLIEDPQGNYWNPPTRSWNAEFFRECGNGADFFVVHSYFTPYDQNSPADEILNSAVTVPAKIMNYMKHMASENQIAMKPVALTEWNIFAIGSKQMVSFINGMHATIVLGELARNGYSLACRWDLANKYEGGNDHGMFNNCDEPGVPDWNPRPAFFYMYYFKRFFGDHFVNSKVLGDDRVLAYASTFQSGEVGIVIVNKGKATQTVQVDLENFNPGRNYYLYSLTGGDDNGEFSGAVSVNGWAPTHATGGPIDKLTNIPALSSKTSDGIKCSSPPRSVQFILIESKEKSH